MKRLYAAAAAVVTMLFLTALTSAQTYTYSTLASFPAENGPCFPNTPLTIDSAGNLYGSTLYGGLDEFGTCAAYNGYGTVFKVTSAGALSTLYNFGTNNWGLDVGGDGAYPIDNLVRDSGGNLYGMTEANTEGNCFDGDLGCGIVFKITSAGVETVAYDLPQCGDPGSNAQNALTLDSAGDLYGQYDCPTETSEGETVFKLTSKGKVSTIYTQTRKTDSITSAFIINSAGNLYGYGYNGSLYSIIELTPKGKLTTLYTFASGITPVGKLTQDTSGNFYGTTSNGGANGSGALFKYSTAGVYSTLYNFCSQTGCTDGSAPWGWLTLDSSKNLYGITSSGGANDYGAIFKITSSGTESVIYSFTCDPTVNFGNGVGLVMDSSGNLYGAASGTVLPCSGANGTGSVYKLTKN